MHMAYTALAAKPLKRAENKRFLKKSLQLRM